MRSLLLEAGDCRRSSRLAQTSTPALLWQLSSPLAVAAAGVLADAAAYVPRAHLSSWQLSTPASGAETSMQEHAPVSRSISALIASSERMPSISAGKMVVREQEPDLCARTTTDLRIRKGTRSALTCGIGIHITQTSPSRPRQFYPLAAGSVFVVVRHHRLHLRASCLVLRSVARVSLASRRLLSRLALLPR